MSAPRSRAWQELLAAVGEHHPIDPGSFGEYALLLQQRGANTAARAFPAIAAHLRAGCAQCTEDLAGFAADGVAMPTTSGLKDVLRRRVATLIAGPGQQLATSFRGATAATTWTFVIEPVLLTINATIEEDGFVLVEGILGGTEVPEGGQVRFVDAHGREHVALIDTLGNFAAPGVRPGTYRLEIELDQDVLTIESLVLGE
jgi:hypothetical protein